jgi:hypothetical protein
MDKLEKYTKKASARILKEVLKFVPKISGHTSLDQAFVILMDNWNLELSVMIKYNTQKTKCLLHRDEEVIKEYDFDNNIVWIDKVGDWDWNIIYKEILEDIIKNKLYKRPKLSKRAQKKLEEAKNQTTQVPLPKISLDELKKKRNALSSRISLAKKAQKNPNEIAELEKQLNDIKLKIKNY